MPRRDMVQTFGRKKNAVAVATCSAKVEGKARGEIRINKTSGSESEVVDVPPRSTLLDRPCAELLLLTIRNMLMRLLNVK